MTRLAVQSWLDTIVSHVTFLIIYKERLPGVPNRLCSNFDVTLLHYFFFYRLSRPGVRRWKWLSETTKLHILRKCVKWTVILFFRAVFDDQVRFLKLIHIPPLSRVMAYISPRNSATRNVYWTPSTNCYKVTYCNRRIFSKKI